MDVKGNEDVREEHIYNAPSTIDTCEDVSHNKRIVRKALANKASDEEHYSADDKGFGIDLDRIIPAFVVTLRTDWLFIL